MRIQYLTYAHVSKETCSYGKRDLFIWQKRPVHMAKEAYGEMGTPDARSMLSNGCGGASQERLPSQGSISTTAGVCAKTPPPA